MVLDKRVNKLLNKSFFHYKTDKQIKEMANKWFVLLHLAISIVSILAKSAASKLDSEAAQAAEENVKDTGGLLDDEYAEINFAEDFQGDDADDRYLPENMLSVVFNSKEKCFYEDLTAGSVLKGAWFLASSEPTGILTRVKKTTGTEEIIFEEADEQDSGGFTVTVEEAGTYAYCFQHIDFPTSNELVLTFAVDVTSPTKPNEGTAAVKPEHIYPLQRSTTNMYHTLQSLVSELEVILLRIDRHVQTQDSTEFRVWLLTSFETLAIAGITAFQIYFVRRLVNKSRQWV